MEEFAGECSKQEIDRIVDIVNQEGLNVIIGIGGGKALDTAKAVAHYAKLPVVIVPTIQRRQMPLAALYQ